MAHDADVIDSQAQFQYGSLLNLEQRIFILLDTAVVKQANSFRRDDRFSPVITELKNHLCWRVNYRDKTLPVTRSPLQSQVVGIRFRITDRHSTPPRREAMSAYYEGEMALVIGRGAQ